MIFSYLLKGKWLSGIKVNFFFTGYTLLSFYLQGAVLKVGKKFVLSKIFILYNKI